jgi:chemotaxis protein MotB
MEDSAIELDVPQPKPRRLLWVLCGLLGAAAVAAGFAYELGVRQRLRQSLSDARNEAAEQRRQLFSSQDKLLASDAKLADTARERDELQAKIDERDKRLAAQAVTVDENAKIIADLRGQIDAKEGEVSQEGGRISVSLVDQIMFPSGESALSPRGQEVLKKVGGVLKGLGKQQILIGGHTDDRPIHTPQFPSNWELSAARAVAVVHYLVDTVGVDPRKVAAAAYSQYHPRSKDKKKNRRIEIALTPIVEVKRGK